MALSAWYRAHRPAAVIYADHAWHDAALAAFFKNQRIVAPRDLGLAVLDAAVHSEGISVVRQRGEQMGISVVDRLVSRLQHGESGFTEVPKIEKVEGEWMEGGTLRARIWTG